MLAEAAWQQGDQAASAEEALPLHPEDHTSCHEVVSPVASAFGEAEEVLEVQALVLEAVA